MSRRVYLHSCLAYITYMYVYEYRVYQCGLLFRLYSTCIYVYAHTCRYTGYPVWIVLANIINDHTHKHNMVWTVGCLADMMHVYMCMYTSICVDSVYRSIYRYIHTHIYVYIYIYIYQNMFFCSGIAAAASAASEAAQLQLQLQQQQQRRRWHGSSSSGGCGGVVGECGKLHLGFSGCDGERRREAKTSTRVSIHMHVQNWRDNSPQRMFTFKCLRDNSPHRSRKMQQQQQQQHQKQKQ